MLVMPLLNGGRDYGLVADFGMGANYSGTQAGAGTSVTLTVYPDGRWEITFGSGDTPAGTPTSGRWATGSASDIGLDFDVQYTTAGGGGSPTIVNDASSYTQITIPLAISVSKAMADANVDVTVNLRKRGGSAAELTDTSNFAANGA